jgi:hypothetical protein
LQVCSTFPRLAMRPITDLRRNENTASIRYANDGRGYELGFRVGTSPTAYNTVLRSGRFSFGIPWL